MDKVILSLGVELTSWKRLLRRQGNSLTFLDQRDISDRFQRRELASCIEATKVNIALIEDAISTLRRVE